MTDSRQLLDDMEAALLDVDTGSPTNVPTATRGAILKIVRDIKDAAGVLSHHHVVSFVQVVEGVLNYVHQGGIPLTERLVALLLECGDHIRRLMNAGSIGQPQTADPGNDLIEQLRLYLKYSHGQYPVRPPGLRQWHITFDCGRDMLRHGTDPLSILHYLNTLGTIERVVTVADAVPVLDEFDPRSCYLGFALTFSSLAGLAIIEAAFESTDHESLRIVGAPEPLISAPSSHLRIRQARRPATTIDGFQVSVGDTVFVVPMDAIYECVMFTGSTSASYVAHRGQVLPVLRLRDYFGITGAADARENLVIIKRAGQRFGVVVDALLGDAQTQLRPTPTLFAATPAVAALSILGSGDVALVLDLDVLAAATRQVRSRTRAFPH
ncbi:chemotaxis protein CheW [Pigmentiphaga aceris]|nr:chemotaxis protein CheW [Pigmentiphaga aceris]